MPGGRGGGGRGAAPAAGGPGAGAAPGPVPVSAARLARLKRFDLDWQTAAGAVSTAKLSATAQADLTTLKSAITRNLIQLEADSLELVQMAPALPFAPALVAIIEARIRVDDVNSENAARTLTDVRNQLTKIMAAPPVKMNAATAGRAADATVTLRSATTEWFNFYNGYDPMFTWWMGMPYKQIDKVLEDYAGFLREKVADAGVAASPASVAPIQAAAQPKFASVPDLNEVLALPQDEMRDIVNRFNAEGGRGGGRGGPQGAQPAPAPVAGTTVHGSTRSSRWISIPVENAQVDYLYIKWRAETDLAHEHETIPPGPPFRPDDSKIQGKPRERDGLISDLRDNMIPYTPEQLIALANREFEWCVNEMKKASRAMGLGDDWKQAIEKVKQTAVPPGGQPRMIMDLLDEAVAYLRVNDLITVPAVAAESLHMTMLSPQAQLTSPFFLGGNHILVSYPTDTMEFDARMQSMRQQPGFSHATAFHEMIPGHNLVGCLGSQCRDYRPSLTSGGPFYGEAGRSTGSSRCTSSASTRPRSRRLARSSGACTAARASSSR